MLKLDVHDPYHILFLEETLEQIEEMEQALLVLESGKGTDETLHHLFRMAHSLKGSAATLEIHEMMTLAHHLEGVMTCLKEGVMPLTETAMNLMLESIDGFKAIYDQLRGQTTEPFQIETIQSKLAAYVEAGFCPAWQPEMGTEVTVVFEKEAELKSVKSFMVVSAIEEIGHIESIEPACYEDLADEDFGDRLVLHLATKLEGDKIVKQLEDLTEIKEIIVNLDTEMEESIVEPALPEVLPSVPADTQLSSDEKTSVRVSVHKINQLINLVGELIVDKESLHKISKEISRTYKKNPAVIRLLEVYNHIDYLGTELQEIVLSTRMLPLETVFNKFPRMVRDLAKRCEKQVEFIMEGKETGIDRGMIEELVDPLTHLLRNAVDHGIDSPAERLKRGKPAGGVIRLSASQGENHVILMVSDDGNGMDPEKIKKKALERGLITAEEAPLLSREDILSCIFKPGFSTAETVSEISGRGVGLDVVKANIAKLNGMIDVQTEIGEGTRFIIKLPLTLAIVKAMLIREGECVFAIPVGSILEVIRLKAADHREAIHQTGKSEVFTWRELTIPLVRLSQYFDITEQIYENRSYIVVVGHGEKKTAIKVERILGEQEIVIKSMGGFMGPNKLLGELRGISGVSILGDGSFAHILDIAAVSNGVGLYRNSVGGEQSHESFSRR